MSVNSNEQTKKDIQKELITQALESQTENERADLIEFMKYMFQHEKKKEFFPEKYHYLLADRLKSVLEGKTRRLMINIPPRH